MAEYRRGADDEYRRQWNADIEGNTVLSPDQPEVYPQKKGKLKPGQARRRRQQAVQAVGPAFVLFMALMGVMLAALCVGYIRTQASINTHMSNIEELEESIGDLTEINENTRARIDASVDMTEIYRIATEELGMVYPDDDQVIYYDRTESEYVQQYEDIPGY